MKPIEWRPRAEEDVADAAYWYAREGGLPLGKRFIAAVEGVLTQVAGFPAAGSLGHATVIDDLAGPLRFVVVPKFERYLVYYLDLPSGIHVVRVWHSSRGLEDLVDGNE
jgi:toxin ParE1/3/4